MNYNNMGTGSAPGPLARQPSVYGLTLDELQSTIGAMGLPRDLGSMNMDDFLKNIWTAEESHAMASSSAAPPLQRQGSLTLPRTLSHKTVDEVWRDFPDLHRQPTLGEMTLEEFLVRAGVVREDVDTDINTSHINTTLPPPPQIFANSTNANGHNSVFYGPGSNKNAAPGLTLGFGQPALINGALPLNPAMSRVFPVSELPSPKRMRGAVGNGLMGGGAVVASSPTNRISADGLAKSNGDLSSLSPAPYVFGGGLRARKNGAVEKVVERRQKRMIKNRESAARSRARKQAYTMELESEIAKLKEQNEVLQKKQVEIMEMQKNQVLEMINQQHIPKKRCLRRTQTGPW